MEENPLCVVNWGSCSCEAGSPQIDGSPLSLALAAQTACLQAVAAHHGILPLGKPAVFQAAIKSAFSSALLLNF